MTSGLEEALEHTGGHGRTAEGVSISTFLASLATAIIVFVVEFLLFLLLKGKLTRIYQPRTYLVPDRERTTPSPPGLFRWIGPVFRTSSSEFIQKCGLDAYFFLRYLRMLLKIFLPLGLVILPVLLPINRIGGKGQTYQHGNSGTKYSVTGLDQLAWGNVTPEHTHRYWAHLVMAVIAIIYVCFVFFDELRNYIRLRQAYLTSPQHRLRASATTVLVTSIPPDWLNIDALDRLFDVFPGGVRNIWLNRNFDDLNEKVKTRNDIALRLESAETDLIAKCKKAQLKRAKAEAKKAGKSQSSAEKQEQKAAEKRASQMAMGPGVSSGNPHQAHTVQEVLHGQPQEKRSEDGPRRVFDPAFAAAGAVGQGVGKLGKTVLGGFKKVEHGLEKPLTRTGGFVATTDNVLPPRSNTPPGPGQSATADKPPPRASASPAPEPLASDDTMCRNPTTSPKPPFWRRKSSHTKSEGAREADEYPLTAPETPATDAPHHDFKKPDKDEKDEHGRKEGEKMEGEEYPIAYNENFENEDYGEPLWKEYIRPKDRDTMRLPIFGWSWMPSIWLLGKKVDTIDYCRKELARLNLEIEVDQQHPERFPSMNSAFIQFNHQVAAHMACQSVSHHLPKQMAPRVVEISPDDVIWDNMSIKWWERYLRSFGIITLVSAMVVGWAFPVAFTGLLSQLAYLEGAFPWLAWLGKLPDWLISAVQGILPALCLAILMALLPLILRFLSRTQGLFTGMSIELTVQNYYFAFLFVQLFLVVTIASSFSTIIENVTDVTSWPQLLAVNIPKSSNYFFSYMILQAMSVSAGALVQIFGLVSWFILAPILDSTARKKWARTTNLNQMQWGTFFPVYTTLASIGLIYCVVAPLILVFNVITFGLFWFVYRYNTLYVTKFRFDTGGLLFPRAINQLFTGIYVMEVCLIGLFFLVRDADDNVACEGQAICMIVVLILTAGYQILLNEAFSPLIRYLPITLEDEAVRRDDEFRRAQHARLGLPLDDDDDEDGDVEHTLAKREHQELQHGKKIREDIELKPLETNFSGQKRQNSDLLSTPKLGHKRPSWASNSSNRKSKYYGQNSSKSTPTLRDMREKMAQDAEAQGPAPNSVGQALFAGIHDELEDLTPDERDQLVQRAFQHEALRAKRPVIWIPRDDLGVSDDEVYRTQRFSKHIWISNEYQALDGKCRTIFSRSPPDFSEVDLIQL
ncbi:hypothetical protein N7489_004574 [Penicillium chrysogenum]|uniref:DUF221-domain-containing protein n=1 Tax=Penicillium chrysogenum TaxID=5076 RepID=A0ABQ8WQ59_PENCH|nr:uncharacterized protein N7489_004574 [Penicillium chrysogenum]KAJ5244478.1 hypothetical protein N7489_004574 [Penicillium chrysogenum]KAJ5274901.1 hypothetical protein N7505_003446 [Penicillium chrysogenum]KAJ5285387.1 hypothetical protein N7524_000693 [Penicillium chrysogenum]